jgi:hyperosmotically inducible periplasmic protein
MKLRNLAMVAAVAALAGVAGCDRNEPRDRVSAAPSPATPPKSAPSMPSQSPSAAAPPATTPGSDRTAGQVVDDAGITAKVKAALIAEKGVNGMTINVDTSEGKVTLTGKVPDPTQVERATQVVLAIDGVKAVDNKLTVGAG